ncbi:hypothetical protein Tco_0908864 [Tanacetum coccineum]|uniref:Reverse transcriptase domain-containing protein n=1 Tax=Tanacetum coccineum TaxID=301880 RepID=A0ABQ5CUU0_9ASTR
MTPEAIEEIVNRRVEEALATYKATRAANALEAESQSQNGSDDDNQNGGYGNSGNGNGNPNENNRDARPVVRECTYQDFMKCQPLNFKGTEGVVGLIRWFEKIEIVFHISNCPEKYQVNYIMSDEMRVSESCNIELWEFRALTVRKSVRPLPSHRLALRYTSHHLDHFTSYFPGSSSSQCILNHSSFGHSISGHSLSEHTPPDTTDADSSTPPRFVHPSLTVYRGLSPLERCKSPAATVTSSIHATRALVSFPCDLLHTSQEFRDFYFHQRIVLRRHWILIVAEIEARYKAVRLQLYKDSVRHVEEGLQDIYGHVMEIPLQRIKDIETGQRELEALDHVASLERSNARLQGTMMMERARADSKTRSINMTLTRSGMTPEAIEELVNRRVEEALAAYEATRAANALEAESQSQNGSDDDKQMTAMNVQPLNFKEQKELSVLIRWFRRIETVFPYQQIVKKKYQVKYAT